MALGSWNQETQFFKNGLISESDRFSSVYEKDHYEAQPLRSNEILVVIYGP